MKTLKIFFIAALLSFFAFSNNFAQTINDNKYFSITTLNANFYLGDCELGTLTGELICYNTHWSNGKTQIRAEGTVTGDSGKEYYVIYTANWNKTSSIIRTDPYIFHIFYEGQLVAITHVVAHGTMGADGNWHLDFSNGWTKCF